MSAPMRHLNKIILGRTFVCLNLGSAGPAGVLLRCSLSTVSDPSAKMTILGFATKRLGSFIKQYEDFSGLTDVRDSQNRVIEAEKLFSEMQDVRRKTQQNLQGIQTRLKEVQLQLDKAVVGDDKYLNLVTQKHDVAKEEKTLSALFNQHERTEREQFTIFSNTIRDGREREKTYAERTKYWSVIGSIAGAVIGIFGSTVSSYMKRKELQQVVKESTRESLEIKGKIGEVSQMVLNHQNELSALTRVISDFRKVIMDEARQLKIIQVEPASLPVISVRNNEDRDFVLSMSEKPSSFYRTGPGEEGGKFKMVFLENREEPQGIKPPVLVHLGKDVEELFRDAQNQLEINMKKNSMTTVALVYGGVAIMVPILLKLFGGP